MSIRDYVEKDLFDSWEAVKTKIIDKTASECDPEFKYYVDCFEIALEWIKRYDTDKFGCLDETE